MGHFISEDGVEANVEKVQAMVEWTVPKNIKELRGLLGLTGYYCRFVQNYGTIAAPLTQLLKKGSFMWTDAAQTAFDVLKRAMVTLPVLALPDFSIPFTVEIDASGTGLGAVLSQQKRPIANFSHTLSAAARAKCIYERELMAIVLVIQRWRPNLLGQKLWFGQINGP